MQNQIVRIIENVSQISHIFDKVRAMILENLQYYGRKMTMVLLACFSEDRNALNKLSETIKTNFNDRVDEVRTLNTVFYLYWS